MLDLVPLARSRWEMADVDGSSDLISQLLKLGLPHARAIAVAATGVGRDEVPVHSGSAVRPSVSTAFLRIHRERRSCRDDPVDPQSTTFDRLVLTRALALEGAR